MKSIAHPSRFTAAWLLATVAMTSIARADEARPATVKAAIERSVPFLQKKGQGWIDVQGCVSCHQVPSMVWSLNAASGAGVAVDAKKLAAWNEWAVKIENFLKPAKRKDFDRNDTAEKNIDTMTFLLLATDERQAAQPAGWRADFAAHLLREQLKDGSWKPRGQLPSQKRPSRETKEVTTMWTLYALSQTTSEHNDAQTRAVKWLGDKTRPKSTEWLAARLLLERHVIGGDATAERENLLKAQNADGGWGWLTSDDSDAFGTGLAIYALAEESDSATSEAVGKAIQFLIKTQQPDGSWEVHGTKKNAAKRVTPTATYWGTAWAVIGLCKSTSGKSLTVGAK